MDTTRAAARTRRLSTLLAPWLAAGLLLTAGAAGALDQPRRAPWAPSEPAAEPLRHPRARCPDGAEAYARVELFFGLSRPGGVITEQEFKDFVDGRVTPRFPDGLTLLSGTGQFRDASGAILAEGSKLLVLLVPRLDAGTEQSVEAIRSDYRHQFQQQSVLRADAASCVSF